MIIGTVFTLFVVPSIYMFVAKTHKRLEELPEEETSLSLDEAEVVA